MKKLMRLLRFVLLWFAGCSDEYEVAEEPVHHVACITFDKTGSFADHTDDAFNYCGRVMKQFNRDTGGENTRVLISQISSDAILFNGSPRAFMQKFPTKEAFQAALAVPHGSRVYGSMADTLEKLCRMHKEHAGMKSCFVCLSDLQDNTSASGDWQRLTEAFQKYATHRGVVALHWVQDEEVADQWRDILKDARFRSSVVTTRTDAEPPVPRF